MNSPIPEEVKQIYDTYPKEIQHKLLLIRTIIFDVADSNKNIGELEEGIKWGEPSYITNQTKSGSTIRLGWKQSAPDQYGIYFNCKTTLVETYKEIFGNKFKYEGNRSILFKINDRIPKKELSICISMALTYHLDKKKRG
jgi:hypothetical protein